MKWKLILAALLVLSFALAAGSVDQAKAQATHSLELQGLAWNHATLSVLVIPRESEPWWVASYINATLRAVSEWNHAIIDFASNYSAFAYLSGLRLVPTISNVTNSGFDIYISWTEASSNTAADEIGSTQNAYRSSGVMIDSTISLAAQDSQGFVLNEVDMQNVALHELGHSLCLGHGDYPRDIMYPLYTPKQTVQELSTLDVYGVSMVFQWMSKSNQFNPAYIPQASSLTLPSDISYYYLQTSYANLPPAPLPTSTPPVSHPTVLTYLKALLNYILQTALLQEFLIPIVMAVSAFIITEIVFGRLRKAKRVAGTHA